MAVNGKFVKDFANISRPLRLATLQDANFDEVMRDESTKAAFENPGKTIAKSPGDDLGCFVGAISEGSASTSTVYDDEKYKEFTRDDLDFIFSLKSRPIMYIMVPFLIPRWVVCWIGWVIMGIVI